MRKQILTFVIIETILAMSPATAMDKNISEEQINLKKSFSNVSWNLDTAIGTVEEGPFRESHSEWRVGARMPAILAALNRLIVEQVPDSIHIQEGRKFTTKLGDEVDSINPIIEFLKNKNYNVSTAKYNPSDRAFSFITAIKSTFTVTSNKSLYFTKTPDIPTNHDNHHNRLEEIKKHNFGEEWERSAYFTTCQDLLGNEYGLINIHKGTNTENRLQSSHLLNAWVKDIKEVNPKMRIIVSGDFNTFPEPGRGGEEQLSILTERGILRHGTKQLKLYNTDQNIDFTYFTYPYDFGYDVGQRLNKNLELTKLFWSLNPFERKAKVEIIFKTECKDALASHLDHMFYVGFNEAETYVMPNPLFGEPIDGYTGASVKQYILDHHTDGPAFASDHQPLFSILKF